MSDETAEKKKTPGAGEAGPKETHATPPREDKKCSQEGCKRPYKAKALCNVHYRKWRHGELPNGRYKTCTKEGCLKKRAVASNGSFCDEHAGKAEAAAA